MRGSDEATPRASVRTLRPAHNHLLMRMIFVVMLLAIGLLFAVVGANL